MKIKSNDFRVKEGAKVDLAKWPTKVDPFLDSKEQYKVLLDDHVAKLSALQELHYASKADAVLLILQGMDASGKDGVIRHVMSGVNPQGCRVYSFKQPTETELEHDFLWRTTHALPERGRITIFNRSYYEEVLVVKVHPEILEREAVADASGADKKLWKERYRSINNFERHLGGNGTRIVKVFLHLSKEEQKNRFLQRLEQPEKNWKFSDADLKERGFWDEYRKAYEACLAETSSENAPWFIVPADDKSAARLIVSEILLNTFESLEMHYPKTSPEREKELQAMRKDLIKE
jgi:PPK2 family polyphosphate:nucleotide phosphotransferase